MAKNSSGDQNTQQLQQAYLLAQQAAVQMKKATDLAQQSAHLLQKAIALAPPISSTQEPITGTLTKQQKKKRHMTNTAARRIQTVARLQPESSTATTGFAQRVENAWDEDEDE